jgi:hypothetical protein
MYKEIAFYTLAWIAKWWIYRIPVIKGMHQSAAFGVSVLLLVAKGDLSV